MSERTSEIHRPCVSGEQTEAVFRMFFDNHHCGLLIADRDGTSVHINRKLADILGYDSFRRVSPSAAKRFVTSPSGMGDRQLWATLLRDGLVVKHRIAVVTRAGTVRGFLATGSLLERKRDGNHLAGWTVSEDTDVETEPSTHRSLAAEPHVDPGNSLVRSLSALAPAHPVRTDHSGGATVTAETDEAMKLALHLMAQHQKDLEARLALNWELSVLPILDHLKALDMADCQRVLLETLDFSLRHIMSAFGIPIVHNSRRLSYREREICQMIRAGKGSREIAQALGLKHQTVMGHRKRIRKKLDLKPRSSRLAAVLQAQPDLSYTNAVSNT